MKPGTASLLLLSASAPGVPESITMATAADSHWSFYRPFSDLGSDGSLGCCARKSPFSPGLGGNSFASFSLLFPREILSCPWSRQCLQCSGGVVLGTGRKWNLQVSAVSPVTPTDLCLLQSTLAGSTCGSSCDGRTKDCAVFSLHAAWFCAYSSDGGCPLSFTSPSSWRIVCPELC